MLLPRQYGVYEQEKGIFPEIKIPEGDYKVFTELFHIQSGLEGYKKGVAILQKKSSQSDWAFWFTRNCLIDGVGTFYQILTEGIIQNLKDEYEKISEFAHAVLNESWFLDELKKRNLEVPSEIKEAIEFTYMESRNIDK